MTNGLGNRHSSGNSVYAEDFGQDRFHHEIYLSDVRRCKPERLKTVIRHPVRKIL